MKKEEAMKILKDFHDKSALFSVKTALDTVFPELAESEDERIRKSIIAIINNYVDNSNTFKPKMIAWLENQSESDEIKAKEFLINKGYPIDANGTFPTYEEMYNIIREGLEKLSEKPQGKTALEAAKEENVDNANKVEPKFHQGDWVVENIFPELKESKDEKIRKMIINHLTQERGSLSNEDTSDAIAWLEKQGNVNALIQEAAEKSYTEGMRVERKRWIEKQGEQKPTDKIESKFKVGDFIVNDYCFGKVIEITNDAYLLDTGQGIPFSCEHNAHLWTIADAKDGDVVVDKSDGTIGIFQSIGHHPDGGSYNDPSYCFLHCRYDDGYFYADFENGNTMDSDDAIPATKEQRDTLMKAMADAGWEWSDKDRKLIKIVK